MWSTIQAKIFSVSTLQPQVATWRKQGKKIVFTNGCFDLLHLGHLHYLSEARSLGDILIVGVNSTDSVRRLKGNHRPIHDEQTRLSMLASLQYVDAVIPFGEDTPAQLIKQLLPDVLVKGGDYTLPEIVGATTVQAHGGDVKVLSFLEGYSTTKIEEKIKNS